MVPRTASVPLHAPTVPLPAAAAAPRAAAGPAGELVTPVEDGAGMPGRVPAGTVDGGSTVLAGAIGEG